MKVGILTYHRAINYGAYLQACALCNRLNEESDVTAELIDFHMDREVQKYSYNWSLPVRMRHLQKYRFLKSREQAFKFALNDSIMIRSKEYQKSNSVDDFVAFVKDKYDVIVVGSDEVWNFNNFRGFPNPYWLLGDLGCRKLSYAASSRQDFSALSAENRNLIKENLLQFDFIGVRDKITKHEIEKLIPGIEVHLCCDPTFLYDFKLKKKKMTELMQGRKGYDATKANVVVMSDDRQLNDYIYRSLRKDYNLISVASCNAKYINVPDITPLQWLDFINSADVVFTTYFHGTCFGIITQTPFLSFGSKTKSSKVSALLLDNGFEEYYVNDTENFIQTDALSDAMSKLMDSDNYAEFVRKCTDYVTLCRFDFCNNFIPVLKGEPKSN